MKVLMLGWELPPFNSGGLGVACFQLCKSLAKNNVDIEFVLPYKTDQSNEFMTIASTSPKSFSELKHHINVYDNSHYLTTHEITSEQMNYEKFVEKKVTDQQYDIIHAHDWLTFRAGMKAKQVSGLPLVVHVHSIESDRAGGEAGNPMIREIEQMGLQMADIIIAVSERTRQLISKQYHIPLDKIQVVHNSIDVEELSALDDNNIYTYLEVLKKDGYKIVTNVGRLTIQKNITGLMKAAKEVVAVLPKTIFLIVGSGEQFHELIALAADLGILQNVIFTGFQRGKAWRDAFSVADLFVMPSISEPFGITPLEAINYGTPSLISHQSGVSEIFKNCLKVDFWDCNEMANQIVGFLQNKGISDTLTKNASSEVKKLSWNESASKLVDIYTQHTSGAVA